METPPTIPSAELRALLHRLRNAINVMVTSARCLQGQAESDDPERESFHASLEQGADEARRLLAELQERVERAGS